MRKKIPQRSVAVFEIFDYHTPDTEWYRQETIWTETMND
jgi:hypothetical protein